MFEHLDDHNPGRMGNTAQLAAVHNRAREITQQRRRSHLAIGSVTVAVTASVSAAAYAVPGGPGAGGVRVGAGASGGHSGAAVKSAEAGAQAKRASAGLTSTKPSGGVPAGAAVPTPTVTDRSPGCSGAATAAAELPPPGYLAQAVATPKGPDSTLPFRRADGQDATVNLKITCTAIAADERTTTSSRTVTPLVVAGRHGFLWHAGADESGVEWSAADGTSVFIKALGAEGVRLTDAELEAYAASLPVT